jgi:TolB protein
MTSSRSFAAALVLVLAAPAAAQERPTIELGSPNFTPLPIAVAPFTSDPAARPIAAEVNDVVRGDLVLSGLFEVLDPRGFLAEAAEGFSAPTIKFARWADVGADGLVKARIRRVGTQLEGELHLYEVGAGREVVFQVHQVAADGARELGHRFADDIVRYYTREPGVFRTKLVAIRKAAAARELVLYDADGRNARVLLSEKAVMMLPAWRPNGDEVLVTSWRSGRPELWSYRLADRSFRRVLAVGNGAMEGVYSPDGSRIAFSATQGDNTDVWVANADGTSPRRLTKEPGIDVSPTWSPDGKRLAFVSNRAGSPQIYVMQADGTNVRRLTYQGNYNQTPTWSPRGDQIAFTARDERRVFDVFVISVDSGRIQRVTQDQGRTNEEPTWAPNGRLLAFTTDRNGPPQLVISNPTGDRQTVVTSGKVDVNAPAWGPLPD